MELRQLHYFVAIAEEGQFTRAAARVSVAQPAVSAQIRRLERELGERLFVRDPQGARLTDAGAAFLPHARAALTAAAAITRKPSAGATIVFSAVAAPPLPALLTTTTPWATNRSAARVLIAVRPFMSEVE